MAGPWIGSLLPVGNGVMGIVFFCQSCGARFEVDPKMSGKKGKCKKCGQPMEIPRAEQIASMAAMPALARASAVGARKEEAVVSVGSWIGSAKSDVGLAPVTVDRMEIGVRRGSAPSPMDDADDSKPYILSKPISAEPRKKYSGRPNVVVSVWRGQLGAIQKLFRFFNETAYLISVPFLIALLLGAAVRNRSLALSAATVVVLLNVTRLVTGAVNLAMVPLRDGLNTRKMKKPFRKVLEPAFTIGLVVLAFTFIPWLSTGKSGGGNVADRLSQGAKALGDEMRGEVDKAQDKATAAGLDDMAAEAKAKLIEVGKGLKKGQAPDGP